MKLFLIFSAFLFKISAYSHDIGDGIATKFQFPIVADSFESLKMTSTLISFLDQQYRVEILKSAHQFSWNFDWHNEYLGAGSNFNQHEFQVMLWGGFVRAPGSNFEIVAFTLCHEIGHYLAGAPYQVLNHEIQWSSAEGQADWFAAKECLPKVFNNFSSFNKYKTFQHEVDTSAICDAKAVHKNLCQWILGAGQDFSEFTSYYFLDNGVKVPTPKLNQKALEEPALTIVSSYPSAQCRLDTIKLGGLCAAGSLKDCIRPRCWYHE